jgi:glycosyltransferase involved in cell wall biosynthesis
MIESLACGTPVVAFDCGSVPEVLENGKTAFIVQTVGQAAESLQKIGKISRQVCRHEFERRFTSARMAENYVRIFERLDRGTVLGGDNKDSLQQRNLTSGPNGECRARLG